VKFRFSLGDSVRLSNRQEVFDIGYEQKWTDEIIIITEKIPRSLVIYKIKDLNDEEIEGIFYDDEMQKVIKSDIFKVEKILKTRKLKGVKESFVKWRGYPESFNSWVRTDDITDIT
jgi:hypothetical protein